MANALQVVLQGLPEEQTLPVCPNCGCEVDGDRFSFLTMERRRCNRIACVRKWEMEYDLLIRRERDRRVLVAKLGRKSGRKKGR